MMNPINNLAVLSGHVANEPVCRSLPDGATVVQFDLRTTGDADGSSTSRSVPVAWHQPAARDVAALGVDMEVVVTGVVNRRFFRVGGQTQSRTEVVIDRLVPLRRKKAVAALLESVSEQLSRARE